MIEATTHTPGPWTAEQDAGDDDEMTGRIFSDSGDWIAEVHTGDGEGSFESNARLIAASPDLLAALENLMHETEGGQAQCGQQFADAARAAIAKAKGA